LTARFILDEYISREYLSSEILWEYPREGKDTTMIDVEHLTKRYVGYAVAAVVVGACLLQRRDV